MVEHFTRNEKVRSPILLLGSEKEDGRERELAAVGLAGLGRVERRGKFADEGLVRPQHVRTLTGLNQPDGLDQERVAVFVADAVVAIEALLRDLCFAEVRAIGLARLFLVNEFDLILCEDNPGLVPDFPDGGQFQGLAVFDRTSGEGVFRIWSIGILDDEHLPLGRDDGHLYGAVLGMSFQNYLLAVGAAP